MSRPRLNNALISLVLGLSLPCIANASGEHDESHHATPGWGLTEKSATEAAEQLQNRFETVAVGRVLMIEDAQPNSERPVSAKFLVTRAFKGLSKHDVLTIKFQPGMIEAFSNDQTSRFEERAEQVALLQRRLKRVEGEIQSLRALEQNSGDVSQVIQKLEEQQFLLGKALLETPRALPPFSSHGRSFYDLGGVISPGSDYLIGMKGQNNNGEYEVNSLLRDSLIFWGEDLALIVDVMSNLKQ